MFYSVISHKQKFMSSDSEKMYAILDFVLQPQLTKYEEYASDSNLYFSLNKFDLKQINPTKQPI